MKAQILPYYWQCFQLNLNLAENTFTHYLTYIVWELYIPAADTVCLSHVAAE